MIAVFIPVLGRPHRAQPIVDSIRQNSKHVTRILFLCSPEDTEEIDACFQTGADVSVVGWPAGHGDWARKINQAYRQTKAEFFLLGADDLRFHPGWDDAALGVASSSMAGVIGTNDLGNAYVMRGLHSTHPLVRRSYIDECGTIDEEGKVLHEGYGHQWVDTELVETAMSRGQWAFAQGSHVEHLHFMWHKSERDETYDKAQSTSGLDARLFTKRRVLWTKELRNRNRRRSLAAG